MEIKSLPINSMKPMS